MNALASGRSAAGVKSPPPGRTISSTPMKPPASATQVRRSTRSPSTGPASTAMMIGVMKAIDHAGVAPGARLLRCAAVGSRGDLVQLRYLVGLLQIDYRDVIMFGEYDVVDGKLAHVRNLNEPLP